MTSDLNDTHAHICDTAFKPDLDVVIERAKIAGLGKIIAVGEDIDDARRNLELSEEIPMIKPAAGLYPTHLELDHAEEMTQFIRENHKRLIAIGEVGLDFWAVKDEKSKEIQREIFKGFIELSNELGLPLDEILEYVKYNTSKIYGTGSM